VAPTATTQRPAFADRAVAEAGAAPRLFRPEPGRRSLEDTIVRIWEDFARDGSASCPACGGRIVLGDGCEGCGSELS
jgi:hypothetical protein